MFKNMVLQNANRLPPKLLESSIFNNKFLSNLVINIRLLSKPVKSSLRHSRRLLFVSQTKKFVKHIFEELAKKSYNKTKI